jgi:cysteine desulfurase
MIFFDNNATVKLSAQALEKMLEVYDLPLNSSSTHNFGRISNKFADEAREEIRNLLNAKNYEVIFTSGASESNNTILSGCDADELIFSTLEHPSAFKCRPENKKITEISILENGLINLDNLAQNLPQDSSFLTSLTIANNETGAIQPVTEAAKLTHQKGGLFHCDLSQGVGKINIDLEKINADFASISAHKFGGPQGVGAILMRKGLNLNPLIIGGGQEKSKRSGTLNIAGIAGFGAACALGKEKIAKYQEIKMLRDLLEIEIKKIAGEKVKIFADKIERLPNTSYFALENCDAQTQLINFDLNKICVSSGSACSSGSVGESQLLNEMKVEEKFLGNAIRVSLGTENNKDEIDEFLSVLKEFYLRNN